MLGFDAEIIDNIFAQRYPMIAINISFYRPLKYKKLMRARTVFWINIGTWIVPVIRPIVRYLM